MRNNFYQEHNLYVKDDISHSSGYPDMGNGRYSDKLSYPDWLLFNKAQRVHLNYLENLPSILISLILAGTYSPQFAAINGFIYVFGRLLYSIFYMTRKAAKNPLRLVGAVIGDICLAINIVLVFIAGCALWSGNFATLPAVVAATAK